MSRRSTPLVAAGLAASLALAGAALAALAGGHVGASTTIRVTEREYRISLSSSSAKAGGVTFVIHNAGKITHKLAVAGGGLKKIAATAAIAPGATRTLTVTLSGGKVSLWCPVPGHAALGMKTSLKIAGTTASEVGQTTEPASTSGSAWG